MIRTERLKSSRFLASRCRASLRSLVVLALVVLTPSAGTAQAQQVPARSEVETQRGGAERTESLEEQSRSDDQGAVSEVVVVTASLTEESLAQLPVSATVLDKEALEAIPALAIDDVLRSASGFSLFRRSSSLVAQPTTQGVSLRGIGPSGVSRTLVLLDGIPLNDPFGGWVTWSRVPKTTVERVEVIRGGSSSIWGSSALGGVIQVFTSPRGGSRASALAEVGERSSSNVDASAGFQTGSWWGRAHGNILDYGGYRTVRADQRGPIDVPADSRHDQVDGRLGWQADETSLSARLERFDEDRSNGTPLTDNQTLIEAASMRAELGAFTVQLHAQDQEFGARFASQADDRSTETPALDQYLVDTDTLGLSGSWHLATARHSVVAGSDVRITEGHTNERFFFSADDFLRERRAGGEEQLAGVFVQDGIDLGSRAHFQVGLRWDQWRSRDGSLREVERSDGSLRSLVDFADRSEDAWSPRVGVSVEVRPELRLKGAAYGAFRSPTINELYRPFRVGSDITAANDGLDPERLIGAEVGLLWTHDRLIVAGTAFRSRIDDPVANVTLGFGPGVVGPCGFTPGGGACRQRQNLGRTTVDGFESELSWTGQRFSLGGFYQLSRATIDRADEARDLEGKRLAQVPEHSASIRGEWSISSRWRSLGRVRYAGRQFEDDLNERVLSSTVVADLGLNAKLNDDWDAFLRIENAFDQEVEVGLGAEGQVTIGAPRTVTLGLRFTLLR